MQYSNKCILNYIRVCVLMLLKIKIQLSLQRIQNIK